MDIYGEGEHEFVSTCGPRHCSLMDFPDTDALPAQIKKVGELWIRTQNREKEHGQSMIELCLVQCCSFY
jgi:hypothetical protein